MKQKMMTLVVALALSPVAMLAQSAQTAPPTGHDHTETVHDRTPHVHDRGTVAHH